MQLSAPIPWSLVPIGAVVMLDGAPRTLLSKTPGTGGVFTVLPEGLPGGNVLDRDTVQLVMLDDTDAVATLAAAGLNPEEITP